MFKTVADWFKDSKEDMNNLAQRQREAELDLLILMMYADRHIDEKEREEILESSNAFTWENNEYHVSLYIDKTIGDVRRVLQNESNLKVFLEDVVRRLANDEAREKALNRVEKFMAIDADISPKERVLLDDIRKIFKA